MNLAKQKLIAFSLHFSASLLVIGLFFLYVIYVLYTPDIMRFEGGYEIAVIIFGVDLVLGPVLTAIVFRIGKPTLKLDIAVILLLQISAFLYGAYTLYAQRPSYLAFAVDHFEVIPASLVDDAELKDSSLAPTHFSGPRVVYVEPPSGERANKITFEALYGGKDMQHYPEFYRSYSAHADRIRPKLFVPNEVTKNWEEAVRAVEEALANSPYQINDVLLAPVKGFRGEGAAIISKTDLGIIAYIDVVIW